LLARIPGYLAVLAAHEVASVGIRSHDPGVVIYEDDYQVVVTPVDT
jgi:hypothetical protein